MEAWEVWNEILDRAGSSISALTPNERIVYRVNCFLVEVETGGVSGFLYNLSPTGGGGWSDLKETADAVGVVGHAECAAVMRTLAAHLESLPIREAPTWDAFLAPVEKHLEANVVPVVNSAINSIYSMLEAFTERHLSR